jgi:hypothetical protein
MRSALLALLVAATLSAADFQLGRAAVKITPPPGIPMAGYYVTRLAEGTHDELHAKAVVFELRGAKAAIVTCDLIHLPADLVAEARRIIESQSGILASNVMISATHSHTGPLFNPRFLDAAPPQAKQLARRYMASLPGRIAGSVRLAAQSLTAARVWTATGSEGSLAFNRRFLMKDGTVRFNPGKKNPEIVQPVGPVDPTVPVVYFESYSQRPLALMVNYALHLDTVGGLEFSADYPATLSSLLARFKGPDLLTLFTLGCAGNINHIDVSSSSKQKGHEEALRIGTILAGEVLKSTARLEPVEVTALHTSRQFVKLPAVEVSATESEKSARIAARFDAKPPPAFLDLVHAFKALDVAARNSAPFEAEVQVIALGDQVAWVGLPGEIFVELGLAIKGASPFPQTIVNSLANGSLGYIPNRKAYAEGAYEVISARVAPGSGEALAESAISQLTALQKRK